MRVRHVAGLAVVVFAGANVAGAQHGHGVSCDSVSWCLGGSAVGLLTHVRAHGGRNFSEAYLTQPMLAGSVSLGSFQAIAVYNLEGYTLRRGELSPGVYGEGYIDRRHPHTHLHELMVGGRASLGSTRVSLFAGKGFVPFGTDDPMMRPFVRYPANHHLSQILERAQIVGAARFGRVALEVATFGGDEPESATDWPNEDRLFDSWSARASLYPLRSIEASASVARVKSPEFAAGFGLNQNKLAASLRFFGAPDQRLSYALIEWARTEEWLGPEKDLWFFATALAEGTVNTVAGAISVRLERTSRPEEHRDKTPFRSVRPLLDFGIVGRTRWDNVTVGWSRSLGQHNDRVQVIPFAEVSMNRARPLERVVVASPRDAFGGLRLFSFSAGVRLGAGALRARMGRYGAGA
ncbi:MAG: hypothetical protein AB1762_03380 [Gemmatimonadota bacterium]